jgi:hypothetical protein
VWGDAATKWRQSGLVDGGHVRCRTSHEFKFRVSYQQRPAFEKSPAEMIPYWITCEK